MQGSLILCKRSPLGYRSLENPLAHGAQALERSKERGADGGKVPSTPRFSNARPGYVRNPPVTSHATPSHSHPVGPLFPTIEATIRSKMVPLISAPLSPPLV